ncbi:MAG: thioredoxin [Caldisericaceae bacterium]
MEVTEKTFKKEVEESTLPVLADFWAEWCVPCKMVEPYVLEIESELSGKLKVVRINVDDNPGLAARFGIMSIPTLAIFVDGKVANAIVGAVPKRVILEKLKPYLPKDN